MSISNRRGVILGVVLIYMIIMTILGYGLLQLSYANSVQTNKSVSSNQAFWAAEAGMRKALAISNFSQTGNTIINSDTNDQLGQRHLH